MPENEHEQEKRNRRVHKQPGVQPMMQFNLQIKHAPLIAPPLHFLDAIAITFSDAEFDETKCVFGKTRFAETRAIAASGREIRNYLAI